MQLEIKNLSKSYGKHKGLSKINLIIPECKTVALVGPSGSGKSTFIRLLAGLEIADEGTLLVKGNPIPIDEIGLARYRKNIGIVFQAFNLFPHLTALDNIALPLYLTQGFSKEDARETALKLLSRFELHQHANKKPSQLSGGQCQRVAIVRAVAVNRELLLFDEPTSALDPLMTSEVLDLIANLEQGNIVLASHHMGFVRKIADWVLFFNDGTIIESAPKEEFFKSPKAPETKQFLEKVLKY